MKRYRVLLFMLWSLLSGCSTSSMPSTKAASIPIHYSAYLGKTVPLFILDNGTPYHSQHLADNNTLYAWNSGQHNMYTHHTIHDDFGEDAFIKSECEIRLLANPKGQIIAITALSSRQKNWEAARCRDYLK